MKKTCPICQTSFVTQDSRRKTCGKSKCANSSRKLNCRAGKVPAPSVEETKRSFISINDLPPVEDLPAEYVKRCYDWWSGLTGEGDPVRRID